MLVGLVLLFVFPHVVGAHAYVERSSPIPESEIDGIPAGVWVQFTEPIDTRVSQLRVENEEGEVIEAEQYSIDTVSMTLRLPTLEDGVYTVYWQVLSIDTHVTDGTFRFALNAALPSLRPEETVAIGGTSDGQIINDETNVEEAAIINDRLATGLRVVELLTIMIVAGWFVFHRLIWTKAGDSILTYERKSNRSIECWLFGSAGVIFIMTGFGHIFSRSLHLTQVSWTDPVVWETFSVMITSSFSGVIAWLRPFIFLALLFVSLRSASDVVIKAVLLVAIVISFPLTGHAYHANMVFPHTIHMLALIVWFSGLLGHTVYSFCIKPDTQSLQYMHERLNRFSVLALFMLILVAISGLILSIVYFGSLNDIVSSNYGTLLLWKMGVLGLILAVVAFHRFVWLPNLAKVSIEQKGQQFAYMLWGLRAELMLVMIVIMISGMLSTTSPPVDIHNHDDHNH